MIHFLILKKSLWLLSGELLTWKQEWIEKDPKREE